MSDLTRVTVEPRPSAAEANVVISGLRAFNVDFIGDPADEPVHVFVRDGAGAVVGGLIGHIRWRWLYVSKLWVAATHRGQGHGAALIAAGEEHARARGCLGVHLDTFEFQARPFYEKVGYTLFGTLDNYPPGFRQYHFAKHFTSASDGNPTV